MQACCINSSIFAKTCFKKLEKYQYINKIFKRFFQELCLDSNIGIVAVLHTFGKDMKFNPHLHIMTNLNINFDSKFNKLWRKVILKNLKSTSNKYYYGYYVWSDNKIIKPKLIAKYIGRYVRHPAIANARIAEYNKRYVKFFYKDAHRRNLLVRKSVRNFISSLIQHIPPKQFKTIRYYGAYSKNKRKTMSE
ncbi:MAG: transposase [Nanoarchaeota archaeon]|nr:transposase [Nanoarchaeota archaeon]